jgi:hypothetical protein
MQARARARKLGAPFDLDQHEMALWVRYCRKVCEVTGMPLQTEGPVGPFTASIDRVDPAKGYVYSNIRIVCFTLNAAMSNWGLAPIVRAMENHRRLLEEMLS